MTPAARYQAAIEILDDIQSGKAAERALTSWGRRSRFAGSGDRAAVRDHVFEVLRQKQSLAILGGGAAGRQLVLGLLRKNGVPEVDVFTGQGHAPAALSDTERQAGRDLADVPDDVRLDCPAWLWPDFQRSLGAQVETILEALQSRAPVHLRVNLRKSDVESAIKALARDGIEVAAHPLSPTALEVRTGARKIRQSAAYVNGQVELQDAASQAVVDLLPKPTRVLDLCAGGGGKSLAIAAQSDAQVFATDINAGRMSDLPERLDRAGADIHLLEWDAVDASGPYDLVLVDAPCSGSGAWRRQPEAKWTLTPERLDELVAIQADVLNKAARLTAEEGNMAYVTCSMIDRENEQAIEQFVKRTPTWTRARTKQFTPVDGGDGFFIALLSRQKS